MLEFIRKYQRYFYLVITCVIIVSFSFFGTYSTLGGDNYREQIAFTAVDGKPVTRGELEQLVTFIGTDSDDKLLLGGMWGPNFLNDGVIRKDILGTGMAQQLIAQYPNEVSQDFDKRLEKEKRYKPYVHPQARFIGVETAWTYLAPQLKQQYNILRSQGSGIAPEAVDARVRLYLEERQLPAPYLHQILRSQQQQYGFVQPDPNLDRTDLSLFNYHTLDDWFGQRFMRLVGELIINGSKIAQQRGYQVSKEEALADLMRNAEISYRDNQANPNIGVANGAEYFNEQLHRLSLDQNKAAQIWRQVLLFRRLFHDVGQAIFIDPQSLQPFDAYAKATVDGDLYRLPSDLRFNNAETMQLFEAYLNVISKRPEEGKALLDLPTQFLSISEISNVNPELVQKRYLLEVAQANKANLQARVGVKETWNWEVEDKNWEAILEAFPEMGGKKTATREERYAILDKMKEPVRARVDAYARDAIVSSHPEWLEKALQDAESNRMTVTLNLKGGSNPFAGLKDPASLINLLDKATMGEQSAALAKYSADKQNFYRIVVIDRTAQPEVSTFAEAMEAGTLENLPKKDNAPLMKAIYEDYAAGIAPEKAPAQLIDDVSASLRFYHYMRGTQSKLKKNPESATDLVRIKEEAKDADHLAPREPLANQWRLEKSTHREERSGEAGDVDLQDVFAMAPGTWSRVYTPVTGDLYFFQLKNKGSDASVASLDQIVQNMHRLLSNEAQQQLMQQLLSDIKAKKAISLDFMTPKEKGEEAEEG
ncbi:MAG: SurA N-terminal domain-containing protein [Parachlamydia sp.]|nr:SurA N-terminal domain-containing protein [Parachlamydia sp.]